MRRLILIATVAISLAACGKRGTEAADQNAGETLTAGSIVSNDVTAIDAVTGDDANMAADVDMNYGNLTENGPTTAANQSAAPLTPRTKTPGKPPLESPAPATQAPTNNSAE